MTEPVWIDRRDVDVLHDRLIVQFGGTAGLRDEALLESALARPRQHFQYADAPDIFDLAAAYLSAIVRNHPFVDGNKRTGFLIGVLFLELNGFRFIASQETAASVVIDLAAGALDDEGLSAFLRENSEPERSDR